MIRVLLADDQPLVRTGLRMILSVEPDLAIVGEASDGAEAITLCARERPDVRRSRPAPSADPDHL
jgi:YesN/AraC family two-component response regulator